MEKEGNISHIRSSVSATPTVLKIKGDGQTLRTCGGCRLTYDPRLRRFASTIMETEGFMN